MTGPGRRTDFSEAPPALRERLLAAVGERCDAGASLRAGERLLAGLLASDASSRDTALELLTADALVTHAFECAADDPESLPSIASAAMLRIARLPAARG